MFPGQLKGACNTMDIQKIIADVVAKLTSNPDLIKSFISNPRSEEHTSELQSQANISYAVFCL